jgi:hypothetical protein
VGRPPRVDATGHVAPVRADRERRSVGRVDGDHAADRRDDQDGDHEEREEGRRAASPRHG